MNVVAALLAALASAIGAGQPAGLPSALPSDRAELAVDLDFAQRTIDDPTVPSPDLASAGRFEQLATLALAREPRVARRGTLAALAPPVAAAMRANLTAATALARLTSPPKSLPPWRILAPPPPASLLKYFKAAQVRFGVPWQYLAAIEFVETNFGRVHGLSTAGAEGPMQFLPATWAHYGAGDVNDPRDAVLGAARFLAAGGARSHLSGALYRYNPSIDYVRAVTAYAEHMRADPRAFYGYYWWQVIYARRAGSVILSEGYPRAGPLPLPR